MTCVSRRMHLAIPALLGLFFAGFAAAGLAAAESAADQVSIDNFTFTPQTLTVKAGTTVRWINHDDIPHTVLSQDRKVKSAALDTDDAFSFKFDVVFFYQVGPVLLCIEHQAGSFYAPRNNAVGLGQPD